MKMVSVEYLESAQGVSGGARRHLKCPWGASRGHLGPSSSLWSSSWAALGAPGTHLGASWGLWGSSRGAFGGVLDPSSVVWGVPEGHLRPSGTPSGDIWASSRKRLRDRGGQDEPLWQNASKHMCFIDVFCKSGRFACTPETRLSPFTAPARKSCLRK